MPDEADYPMNLSSRWTKDRWREPSTLHAHTSLSGKVMNPETMDVTVEAVGRQVTHLVRERVRVLAWLELLDLRTAAADRQLAAAAEQLAELRSAAARLESTLTSQTSLLESLVGALGLVVVPAWQSLAEIRVGDSMGGVERPSASTLGLEIVYEHQRQVPGREHEEILAITPAPGAMVARGAVVTVTLNLNG
ncbi:MAG TPA: hypothetical protein VIT41_00945 [Microlunatus sp.]